MNTVVQANCAGFKPALTVLLALSLAACGSDSDGGSSSTSGAAASPDQPTNLPEPTQPTGAKPTMTIVANPAEVAAGSATTIIWTTEDATDCEASGDWSGVRATQGQAGTTTLTDTAKYTLRCIGPGGSVTRTLTVNISDAQEPTSPPPSVSNPVEPTPVEPTPVEPTPVEPAPVEPAPVDPTPVDPTPSDPSVSAPLPPAPPANAAALGSDWHPDPDGDGVGDSDNCRHVYNPGQADANSNNIGNACEAGFARPQLNGPVTDLRAEHVTPYGGWFNFTSPRSAEYGWQAVVAWTTNVNETTSKAGIQSMINRGNSARRLVYEDLGDSLAEPFIITDMDPDTTYYVVAAYEAYDGIANLSNVQQIRTHAAPDLNMTGAHPRVFASTSLISKLRSNFSSGDASWQAWANNLGSRAISAASGSGSVYQPRAYCGMAALLYAVTDDDRYRNAALSLFELNVSYWEGGLLGELQYMYEHAQLGQCLDLIWNEITPAQRERASRAILRQDEHHIDEPFIIHDTDDVAGRIRNLLIDGLTSCGDTGLPADVANRSCAVLDKGLRLWYGMQLPKARRSKGFFAQSGGTLPDGIFYDDATMGYWFQSLWVLNNAGDPVSKYAPYLRHQLQSAYLHAMTPTERGVFTMGDIESYNSTEPNSFQFKRLNQQNFAWARGLLEISGLDQAAGWSQYVIDKHFPASGADALSIPMLMFNTKELGARDYRADLPLANLDSGQDILLDRTSWSENASQLVFTAGWSGVDHNHGDAGHFQLFRRGAWMTHEPFGYQGPIANGGGHSTLQLQVHDDRVQYTYNALNSQEILKASSNSAHSYAAADLEGAYTSGYENFDAYDLVQRSLVWLKGNESSTADTVVIFDQVRNKSSSSSLARKVRFHIDTAPQINGRVATSTTNLGEISQRVEIAAVLPASASLQHLAPAGGSTAGGYPGSYHTNRVDIAAGTNAQQVAFVSVLRASNANGFSAMNPVAVENESVAGTVIGREAVLFSKTDLRLAAANNLVIDVPASVERVWLAGLRPSTGYNVQLSNNGGSTRLTISQGSGIASDEGGLLSFQLADGSASPTYAK